MIAMAESREWRTHGLVDTGATGSASWRPSALRISRTVEGATLTPSTAGSPWMRR